MKQVEFETRNRQQWEKLEMLLASPANYSRAGVSLPVLYRRLCAHLALAKHRRYSPELLARLNDLASRGYLALYGANHRHQQLWLRFLVVDFPQTVCQNARFVWAATALFLLPGLLMGLAAYGSEELIYSMFEPSELRQVESMYDPENSHIGRKRDSEDDWLMFGFYVYNNVGIAFRTFATGLLFGLGSIFFLFFNGVAIGGIAGHLTRAGYGVTFYPFVIGHSAFELTAIVLSGAAGLKLGAAVLAPGQVSRLTALRESARETATIIYGAGAMLIIAAALEAFWSSKTGLPAELKYGVGIFFWSVVLMYLSSGKGRQTIGR